MRKITERCVMSFTCFAMFFGAGNLIFPAFLSYEAGSNALPAFIGFIMSAITLPVLSLIAVERTGSLDSLAGKIHPVFAKIFTVVIYLAIGPMLAIPRTASTSYEMVRMALNLDSILYSIIYSLVFFLLAGLVSLHPEKLSKRLGRILSPLLITLIILLFISVFFMPSVSHSSAFPYDDAPFISGFLDGYQTMDAIAGLVFGTILTINLKRLGIEGERNLRREGAFASWGGGALLLVIYLLLSIIGYRSAAIVENAQSGADILSLSASFLFPSCGKFLIAAIFILACFNTSVGLLSSCGEYFFSLCPSITRGKWIMIFASVSAVIANIGLNAIISISAPVLNVIYPVAITLMVISLIEGGRELHLTYRLSVLTAFVFSLLGAFLSNSFLWLAPTLISASIGFVLDIRHPERRNG